MTFCRDIKDTTVGTLSQQITNQLLGLKGLDAKLQDMHSYLQQVGGLYFYHKQLQYVLDPLDIV